MKLKRKEVEALATTIGKLNGTFGRRLITNASKEYWARPDNMEATPTSREALAGCGCAQVDRCPNLNKCKKYKGTRAWRKEVRIALREKFKV